MAKEQDVVKLPFRITEFNEDMLMALDRNFKEIEDQLSALQLLIKHITGGGVKDLPNAAEIWKRAENINEDGTISATSLIGQLVEEQISDAAISASKINAGFLIVSDDLWTDNSPINGEIAWNEHDLFWNGRRYTIAAGHTANKYIYWDSMATIYGSSNTMPDLSDTGFLIAINNDGEHQIVWKQAIAKKLIGEEMLAEGAVTATKIANAAIGSAAIAEAAILAAHIHEAAIQTAHIKDAAITSAKIKDIAADKITIGSATTFEPGYNPVDNHLYFQYSVDGINWHEVFNSATDLYMRQKIGDNGTWSEPARIAAVDGVDGQDGVNGTDGISSYLWVRYSQNSNGDPMTTSPVDAKYIGIATTTTSTAPTSYASYSWSLIKGTDGVPGESGADGKTSYLHIKYSDDGVNFTGNGGEDVGVYIGTYVDFNSADSTTFSDYTWNKVKGTPIVWKGDLASPPSNPEENWVYRDIDNGYVYIYNGTVWELMVTDGADGIDGAPGVDGMSVYITYHNNPTDSQPATPTGDGTSGGWYTAPSAQANWMSQKVATNAYSGTWGAPILISGGRKFTSQPVPPYDVGDLWIGGSDGKNTLICTTARSSGSFVASDWGQVTESTPAVSMGVDSDCLGLWHFDGSLNSHKGAAADSDGLFGGGCFGQALNVATGKHLKVPTTDMLASAGAINFRAKNLSASANGSVLIDLPDNAGNQGMLCGIASDGKLFIEDAKLQFTAFETSQADFNTGTLSDVQATSAGNIELVRDGQDFTYSETSQADFNTGTLTDVEATSEGNLELEYTPGETTYGTDFTGGKTYSADSLYIATYSADEAFDNNTATFWLSAANYPHWVKVDLGSGVTKTARKLRIYKSVADQLRTFKLQGSNDNTDWTDIYTNVTSQTTGWFEYTFDNPTAHRYHQIYGTDSYGGNLYMRIAEVELMEEGTTTQGTYTTSGTRETMVDLSGAVSSGGTKIEWSKTTPTDTTVTVETALSTDGGSTYGSYSEATSGSSIPGITSATDLSNARLKIRETLSTTDTSKTPQLHSLSLNIYASYKSSGYRYKVYDISAVGTVGSSQISWTENKPASTTLTVKAAISTDGGSTYGSWQACTSGQAIPGLTQGMDISSARLKVQEDLTTSDGTKTPQLQSLIIDVGSNVQIAYGPNKSTLTAWDSISLAYKSDRLSLVVNDEEACFIENPELPTAFGSHIFIGSDRNGANAINTFVDELRIDKVYHDVATRTGWHKTGVPFYTSEDMKQWPGYMKLETDGLKVYDSSDALRVLVGSWLKDAVRKYGIKIINGEIYSSLISTAGEGAQNFIRLNPPHNLEVYGAFGDNPATRQLVISAAGGGGGMWFYNDGLPVGLMAAGAEDKLYLYSIKNKLVVSGYRGVEVIGGLNVSGGIKNCVDPTENYGFRAMSAVEAPEILFYDRGQANLVNGEATVYFDPIYLEMIEPDAELTPWQIWVQCYGENDVYVSDVGIDYFKIKERNGGTSSNRVIWRFEAIRKGYAGIRLMEVTN